MAIVLVLASVVPASATPPQALYFGQSLLCRQTASGVTVQLWLDPDLRYTVFYDRPAGSHARHSSVRQGRYTVHPDGIGLAFCIMPDPGDASDGPSAALFRDAGCVTLQTHPIGESYTLTFAGDEYTLVLAEGR